MKKNDYEMDLYFPSKDIRVRMTSTKYGISKKIVHSKIRNLRSSLNTIKTFLKETNKARVILDIGRRLFHVDFFLQISMQEGGFNIHLMDLSFM